MCSSSDLDTWPNPGEERKMVSASPNVATKNLKSRKSNYRGLSITVYNYKHCIYKRGLMQNELIKFFKNLDFSEILK